MKSKYVMINGFAFSEESDMEKLKRYASEGWILEGIKGGLFYKLRKDNPQDIVYCLDYQTDASGEYFTIFKEAGWKPVVSLQNYMHIFSAQPGTKPIYSDGESEKEKYTDIRDLTRKGTLYSLAVALVLLVLIVVSAIAVKPLYIILLGLLALDFIVFVFNFMPYMAYNSRIKQIKKYGKCKSETALNKGLWKYDAFTGAILLVSGIMCLVKKSYFEGFLIVIAIFFIVISFKKYKKYNKRKRCVY